MTSREQFEAWHSAKTGWLPRHYAFYWDGSLYEDEEFQVAWEAWQASRAALVIELPTIHRDYYANTYGFNCAVEAIDAAKFTAKRTGLKVRP